MSGICGFCDLRHNINFNSSILEMLQTLAARGTDASWNIQAKYGQDGCLFFGETVQKTMPDAEYQCSPMQTADGKYILVYDGEVYNYREIRKELEAEFQFRSDSDAEVVLYALAKWGMKALDRFNGFFAIGFADLQAGKLYLGRDRGGIRPLYIFNNGSELVFASRLQAIQKYPHFKPEIDESALAYYLKYGYVPEPSCIFSSCMKLRPGHYAEVDLQTGKMNVAQYWDLAALLAMPKLDISYDDAKKRLEELFLSSCEYRCQGSTLPGSLLSGGYDSSGIAAFLVHLHPGCSTYTIGFKDGVDEAPDAEQIAKHLKTAHHQKYCGAEEARSIIAELPDIYDEPFGDSSAIPTTLAARLASGSSKVIFSADSGDETFGGYDVYRQTIPLLNKVRKVPSCFADAAAKMLEAAAVLPFPYNKKHALEYVATCLTGKIPPYHSAFLRNELSDLMLHPSENLLDFAEKRIYNFSGMLYRDFHIGLSGDSFVKVDRAVMSAGIQYREPVMDHRITEFAARLPDSFKINMTGGKKIIFKDLVHKYIPKNLLDRPKHGFSVPIAQWIGKDLNSLFEDAFSRKNVEDIPFFRPGGIERLFMRYKASPENRFFLNQMWYVFCFVNWFNRRVR